MLLVLDAAGARYFGCYGNALPTTPRIDAFAEEATVFERALQDPTVEFFGGRKAAVDPATRERLEALGYAQ